MGELFWIGVILLLGISTVVLLILLSGTDNTSPNVPEAFAILPVPEDTPHVRAFLEYYASQITWMDANILHSVILVSNPQTAALCADLARNYSCYAVMSLEELQLHIITKCVIQETFK